MPIKTYKPTTPGRRHASVVAWNDLSSDRPMKGLTARVKKHGGRGHGGKVSVRHRGGGHKRLLRFVDMRMVRYDEPASVLKIEYDPNRTCRIALIQYQNGDKTYILAPYGLKAGDMVMSSLGGQKIQIGNRMPLAFVPAGTPVSNIELAPGQGGKMVRSAGQQAVVQTIDGPYAQIVLPSGEVRKLPKMCSATIGQMSNIDHNLQRLGKAGRMRWKGRRPQVLGKSMNPVDHPHGGGEGHQPIGLKSPKTKWGKKAFGVKTRKKHLPSDTFIVARRKRKSQK